MKILVTGLGSIGQRHVRNLRTLYGKDVEIFAYRSRRLDLVIDENLKARYGALPEDYYKITSYTDLNEAFSVRPDAILITNPNSLHMQTALVAAEHGCHLFIDKPLSHNLDGASKLQEIVDVKGLVVLVGFQLRFHPALKQIYQMIHDGHIGQIVSASFCFGEYLPGQHPYEDYRRGYAARADQGGGVVLCTHEIDLVYWFFGMPEKVFAIGGYLSELEMDVEDTASIIMQYNLQGREVPVHIQLDFVQRPPKRVYSIVGDRGKIEWDYHKKELRVYDAGSDKWEVSKFDYFQRNQEFLNEMVHFIGCVDGKEEPVVNLPDAVDSLSIALAVKRSMLTGGAIEM